MPCAKGMPVRKDDVPGSGCHARCLHRQMVQEYRDAYWAWSNRRDEEALGYATERREYASRKAQEGRPDPPPMFSDWLKQRWARPPDAEDEPPS